MRNRKKEALGLEKFKIARLSNLRQIMGGIENDNDSNNQTQTDNKNGTFSTFACNTHGETENL